jgi:hypothetical protein
MIMNFLQSTWEILESLSFIHWLIILAVALSSGLIYVWRYVRLQYGFARNLKRRIYFLKTSNSKSLQTERDMIGKVALFNIEGDIKDVSQDLKPLQNCRSRATFIVGYDPEYSRFGELVNEARSKNIPVIIFAKQGEIKKPEHWEVFNGYIYCDVANTSNRLAVILLNILMIA